MKLGERIKQLRNKKELTQPELANNAGIEQSYLSKLENDKSIPSFDIINRISMALDTTALDIIDTLSQSYIEGNLAHIPEVAAEYAVIKLKREKTLKQRFIIAAIVTVIGIAVSFLGYKNIIYNEQFFDYYSEGIIKEGETIDQFRPYLISMINESKEENATRLKSNRGRNDEIYFHSSVNLGFQFLKEVKGGKRLYWSRDETNVYRYQNDLILIFGIMLISTGFFMFWFGVRFKPGTN